MIAREPDLCARVLGHCWSGVRRLFPQGRVLILAVGAQSERLTWAESGGPIVTSSIRCGFGARLLERGLAPELSGGVELTYDAYGLVCHMALPLRALEP